MRKPLKALITSTSLIVALTACDSNSSAPQVNFEQRSDAQGHTAPTEVTIKANNAVLEQRAFSNRDDFDNAMRGFIAKEDGLIIKHLNGSNVWDMPAYDFIDAEGKNAPSSVNPSLWRQASLNNIHGLFKVTEGIYQIRGYDLSNMSIIESDNGWIIVDPLTARETASRALQFAQQQLGKKPIKAILFTHSHIDHFGGVQGILQNLSDSEKAEIKIIAPEGFEEEATSENIIAGTVMSRRAMYMYGKNLARSERGHIGTGLGKGPAFGTFGIEVPTLLIGENNTEQTIDGIKFEFQMVSGSEAPAEFTFYLPKYKAFCGAELVSRNMHNVYTLRGAKVRDANIWSSFIEQARTKFDKADTYFASHHWPLWGQDNINDFLITQRDTYKFIHDQSVRLMNQGFTPNEIADQLILPDSLNTRFDNQGYYGTLKHNAKAVYQNYLGWFTANPAKLDPLPETKAAIRYIDMMGGAEAVLTKAQLQFDSAATMDITEGTDTYRWLAELLNHLVFSDTDNRPAKALLAKVYDQLGYQAESAPWRDFYLTGAYELRHGAAKKGINPAVMKEVLMKTSVDKFFDSMAVRLIAEKAADKKLTVKIHFTDLNQSYLLMLNNSVLRHKQVEEQTDADATLNLTRDLFVKIIIGEAGLKETLFSDELSIDGSTLDLISFFSLMDKPTGTFNIVTP
jgi:alkyl sulfatase BDS1-like metallo-beta-lactamase superfamily hydrolase